jgi:hypothetical protein
LSGPHGDAAHGLFLLPSPLVDDADLDGLLLRLQQSSKTGPGPDGPTARPMAGCDACSPPAELPPRAGTAAELRLAPPGARRIAACARELARGACRMEAAGCGNAGGGRGPARRTAEGHGAAAVCLQGTQQTGQASSTGGGGSSRPQTSSSGGAEPRLSARSGAWGSGTGCSSGRGAGGSGPSTGRACDDAPTSTVVTPAAAAARGCLGRAAPSDSGGDSSGIESDASVEDWRAFRRRGPSGAGTSGAVEATAVTVLP